MKVEYHPSTASDLNDAFNHYDDLQAGLGNAFRDEIYAAIDRVLENPEIHAAVKGVRRALVKRFPYSVVFTVTRTDRVRILLIRHHRRHPEHGATRR